ncbi:MAG: hypothetical protein ABIE84_07070 [bacterium]
MPLPLEKARTPFPFLFKSSLEKNPRKFTRQGIVELHREVEDDVRWALEAFEGPTLCPISIEVLEPAELAAHMVETRLVEPGKVSEVGAPAGLTTSELRNGELHYTIYYNRQALEETYAARRYLGAGAVMVHEILTTVSGPFLQTQMVASGHNNLNPKDNRETMLCFVGPLSFLDEGFACYGSELPYHSQRLGELESEIRDGAYPEMTADLFTDYHFIGALALLKIDYVFHLNPLIDLMHRPVGYDILRPNGVFREVMNLYAKANSCLNEAPLEVG